MLTIKNINKRIGEKTLLENINFSLKVGETLSILGSSGSGKSTLLNIIAGLLPPNSGSIHWNDQDITRIEPHKRKFGLMFQNYALFPHMNVFQNIAFGLKMQDQNKIKIEARVTEILELLNLSDFGKRKIDSLSGGEKQRVALGRTLAPNPRLLLLDEPLSALDKNLRESLLEEISTVLRTTSIPAIYVTHDQEEAFSIADKLIILESGKILQVGTPSEIYTYPNSLAVAKFLGFKNILSKEQLTNLNIKNIKMPKGKSSALIKPTGFEISDDKGFVISGILSSSYYQGGTSKLLVLVNDKILEFKINYSNNLPEIGERIQLSTNNTENFLFY